MIGLRVEIQAARSSRGVPAPSYVTGLHRSPVSRGSRPRTTAACTWPSPHRGLSGREFAELLRLRRRTRVAAEHRRRRDPGELERHQAGPKVGASLIRRSRRATGTACRGRASASCRPGWLEHSASTISGAMGFDPVDVATGSRGLGDPGNGHARSRGAGRSDARDDRDAERRAAWADRGACSAGFEREPRPRSQRRPRGGSSVSPRSSSPPGRRGRRREPSASCPGRPDRGGLEPPRIVDTRFVRRAAGARHCPRRRAAAHELGAGRRSAERIARGAMARLERRCS